MLRLETADAQGLLLDSGVNAAELDTVAAGQVVESGQTNVETRSSVVDGNDMDGLAVPGSGPASAAGRRVPAGDGLDTANVRETRDIALDVPVCGVSLQVLGDNTGRKAAQRQE